VVPVTDYVQLPGGRRAELVDGLRLGRNPQADLELADASVSRDHAQITGRPGRWLVHDLHSRNGTWINERRVAPGGAHPLHHGDRIRCGSLLLEVVLDDTGPMEATTGLALLAGSAKRHFSPYQLDVLRLLCSTSEPEEPLTNAEIALRLGTPAAVDAVKTAVSRIYARAGLGSNTSAGKRRELRRRAVDEGWLS
jgi:predicted component of type VI protein secretion system